MSEFNPKPSWQTVNIPSVDPSVKSGRIIPDVAADATPAAGISWSHRAPGDRRRHGQATPLWAGLLTRILQSGKSVGFLTPKLYAANPATSGKPLGEVACRDITSGSNKSGSSVAGYSALVGYDACTGWGSPNGKALQANLP